MLCLQIPIFRHDLLVSQGIPVERLLFWLNGFAGVEKEVILPPFCKMQLVRDSSDSIVSISQGLDDKIACILDGWGTGRNEHKHFRTELMSILGRVRTAMESSRAGNDDNNMLQRNPGMEGCDVEDSTEWDADECFLYPADGQRKFWRIKRVHTKVLATSGLELRQLPDAEYEAAKEKEVTRTWNFPAEKEAEDHVAKQVALKLQEGYLPRLFAVTRFACVQQMISDWFDARTAWNFTKYPGEKTWCGSLQSTQANQALQFFYALRP